MNRPNKAIFTPDKLISYTAVFVGLCALFVSIYEANIFRQQQKASVWPYLELSFFYYEDGFGFRMQNKGVGPGIINWMIVRVDGQAVKTWGEYKRIIFASDSLVSMNAYISNRVVSPNETVNMIHIKDMAAAQKARDNINRVSIEFCYSSIFKDYWIVMLDSTGMRREVSKKCEIDSSLCFLN